MIRSSINTQYGLQTDRPCSEAAPSRPWEAMLSGCHAPTFEPLVERKTNATHCLSVCLYHEPAFKSHFPARSFKGRYLDGVTEVKAHIKKLGYHINIFADEAMSETAMSMEMGNVYQVTSQAPWPFYQHLYRYLSALLPPHPTIRAYHCRGMDNLLITPSEARLFETLLSHELDVIHAPYVRARDARYMPIRGSCSVANDGISSLGWFINEAPHTQPTGDHPNDQWHSDELFLASWLQKMKPHLSPLTLVDRSLPFDFFSGIFEQVKANQRSLVAIA